MYDILIVGGGAAGVSAALTARNRGKSVAVVANASESSALYKAEKITNYPGVPAVSGRELMEMLQKQLSECGAERISGRALSILSLGGSFGVAVESDFYEAGAIILTPGITREKLYPGEEEFLGRGVSYCATCDGMLYRGRRVALIGNSEEAVRDTEFLRSIGCEVTHYTGAGAYEIRGGGKAETLVYRGAEEHFDGIFIIKDTVSVTQLVPGLAYAEGGIAVNRRMETNLPGIFAAGDCTGKPYQLAKAAGEGNIAALSACEYLSTKK